MWGETNDAELFTNAKDEKARGVFNPLFSSNCVQPTFPSPQPGFLAHGLTQGARTYSTSGPFMYLSKYAPQDFFDRGNRANPNEARQAVWGVGVTRTDVHEDGGRTQTPYPIRTHGCPTGHIESRPSASPQLADGERDATRVAVASIARLPSSTDDPSGSTADRHVRLFELEAICENCLARRR